MEKKKENQIQDMVKDSFGDKPYLRMLFADETKDRVYAKFKGKFFFPIDRTYKKAGWVAAIIVDEKPNVGFIDVIPIEDIGIQTWLSKAVKGAYVKHNWEKNTLEVYPGINKEQLKAGVVQNCILTLELPTENPDLDDTRKTVRQTLHSLKK